MLRVSPYFLRGRGNERVTMGNAAVAEELAGSELDEFYRLYASESEPEDEDDDEEDDGDEGEGIKPEGMPHD